MSNVPAYLAVFSAPGFLISASFPNFAFPYSLLALFAFFLSCVLNLFLQVKTAFLYQVFAMSRAIESSFQCLSPVVTDRGHLAVSTDPADLLPYLLFSGGGVEQRSCWVEPHS